MADRITERELILPALWVMSLAEGRTVSTSELMQRLRDILQPLGEDLSILAGRNDDKFSQKVRNLRSHKTLEGLGFAAYEQHGKNGYWTITKNGRNYLNEKLPILNYILTHGFAYNDDALDALNSVDLPNKAKEGKTKQKIAPFDENAIISEGTKVSVEHEVYVRSDKLRKAAIAHYSKDQPLVCQACSFDFEAVYGELGKGFIEIHHVKPVFAYEDSDLNLVIQEALKNVVPLCSNCHRMVHRRRMQPLLASELTKLIKSTTRSQLNLCASPGVRSS